jgi:hypothetical protein
VHILVPRFEPGKLFAPLMQNSITGKTKDVHGTRGCVASENMDTYQGYEVRADEASA